MHLSSYHPKVSGTVYEMQAFHKSIQIYKPEGSIGPNPDQFRDCIDIAAKLAMNFNASPTHYDLVNLKKALLACEVVRKVANQIDTDTADPKLPIRVKQTSDIVLAEQFYKTLCMFEKNFLVLGTILEIPARAAVQKACKQTLSQADKDPIEMIKELCYHNGVCVGHIKGFYEHAEAEHKQLLGEVDPTI